MQPEQNENMVMWFLEKTKSITNKFAQFYLPSHIDPQLSNKTSILPPKQPSSPFSFSSRTIIPCSVHITSNLLYNNQKHLMLIPSLQQLLLIIIIMNRSILNLSSFKENKNSNNQNRNKTPKRIINGVKLYNFSEIGSYRHINKPYLNDIKKEHIKHKLDLQKATEIRVTKRIKRNDTFIAYNFNPFEVKKPHSKSQSHMPHEDERNNQNSRNIIDEINTLKSKKLNRELQSKELNTVRNEAVKVSTLVQKQLKNATPERTGLIKPKKQALNKSMISLRPKQPNSQEEVQKLEGELDFQDIVSMKQQKFSSKNDKELNIFRLLYDKSFFDSNSVTLNRYFFSFNSVFEKFQKFKTPTYRDLSREARLNASKRPQVKQNENFDTFVQNELNFGDLLNVASGRFTPQIVYNQMHFDRMNDNTNTDNEDDQVIYNDGALNKSTLASNQNQSTKEIQEFLKLAFSKKEEAYHKLNVFRKQEIADKLQKISKLVSLSIYDKKLHELLRKQINGEMTFFVDENYKYPKGTIQRDMLIRTNKESKNKNEIIKLTQLIQTYKLTKQHETHVKELINKRI